MTLSDLDDIHQRLRNHLGQRSARLDAIYACPHDVGQCRCRKPDVGLFERAFVDFPAASLTNSVMIGDSLSDIEAATRLGIPSIFVRDDPTNQKPDFELAAQLATVTAESLLQCVEC